MTINDKLRKFAESHKMGSVAESAGVNSSAMSRYINRGSRVPAEVVAPLAKALRVSIEWLVDDEQDWPPVWKNHTTSDGSAVARSPRGGGCRLN